jgi:hypothetical protein
MVEYPTDLDLGNDKDIHLDSGNDLALTGGVQQLQQSVAIDVMDELDEFISGRLNGENIGLLEESLREALNDDPQLSEVRNVIIQEFNRESGIVSIDVHVVENEDFSLSVEA